MTDLEIYRLRAHACGIMSALGSVLDSLALVEQLAQLPTDPLADALVAARHLEEAAGTADTLAQVAADFSVAVDALQARHQEHAAKLERGAA